MKTKHAEYYALMDKETVSHIKKNIDTGQLEIYEDYTTALNAKTVNTEIIKITVQKLNKPI